LLYTCSCFYKYTTWYQNYTKIILHMSHNYLLNHVYCELFTEGKLGVCDGYFHMHFKICRCIYRIYSNRTWGKYKYGTILQLIVHLIHFNVCRYIYRIICNNNMGIIWILDNITALDDPVQSNVQYKGNNTIHVTII